MYLLKVYKMFGFRSFVICSVLCVLCSSVSIFSAVDLGGYRKSNYTVIEHKSLSIICNATESWDLEIYWTKNHTKSDFYQPGPNLTFPDITRMDAGDYVCHALNTTIPGDNETSNNYTVEVVNIDVQFPAEIAGFDVLPDIIVENQTFNVQCNFMGNPGPTWEIRNNDTKQAFVRAGNIASNSTIGIVAVCGKSGYIECTGYNKLSHGVNATQGKNVTVMCPPRPTRMPLNQNVTTATVGSSVFLFVNVIGYPYPSYSWSRVDGKPMPECTQVDYPIFAILNVTNIKLEDYGIYAVTMNNSLGTHTTTLELRAYGHPEPPFNLTYFNITYYSVALSWVSGYDMGTKQHFTVMKESEDGSMIETYDIVRGDYENHGVNKTWTTTLFGLDSDTEYTLTIQASNEYSLNTLAETKVSFRTHVNPYIESHHSHHIGIALVAGSVGGGLAFIGVLAFVVYMLKYRRMRMPYDKIDKK